MGNPERYVEASNNFYEHNTAIIGEIEALIEAGILSISNQDAFESYKNLGLDDKCNHILKESTWNLPHLYEQISFIINPHKLTLLDLEKIKHRKKLTRASGKEDLENWEGSWENGHLHFKLDLPFEEFLERLDLSYFLYNANMDATERHNRGNIKEKIKSKKEDFVICYYPEGKLRYYYDNSHNFIWTVFEEDSTKKHLEIRPSWQEETFTVIEGDWIRGLASLIENYIKLDKK